MKTRRSDGSELRRILTGMVTDPTVLARIAARWPVAGLFESTWANMVGGWCVRHMRDYNAPPNATIESLFEQWAEKNTTDEKTIRGVERFLNHLSVEHERAEPLAPEYVLDLAGRYFNKIQMRQTLAAVEAELDQDNVEAAEERFAKQQRVDLGAGSIIKPGEDFDAWQAAFSEEKRTPLFRYSGRLGRFVGDAMRRGQFIAFLGVDKSGKSFWLLDAAFRAAKKHRVAYFVVGDLDEADVMQRLGQRAALCPMAPKQLHVPVEIKDGAIRTELRIYKDGLTERVAFRKYQKAIRNRDAMRISCYPAGTISVDGVSAAIADMARDGWVADMACIDYADILAPPTGIKDRLDQIDETWMRLRRMAQEHRIFVLTATQANAAAYTSKKGTMGRGSFSGRKTKNAHVTGILALNTRDSEHNNVDLTVVNKINWRGGKWREGDTVLVAGCLAMARPVMVSGF